MRKSTIFQQLLGIHDFRHLRLPRQQYMNRRVSSVLNRSLAMKIDDSLIVPFTSQYIYRPSFIVATLTFRISFLVFHARVKVCWSDHGQKTSCKSLRRFKRYGLRTPVIQVRYHHNPNNRPFSFSWYWTGTSFATLAKRGVFKCRWHSSFFNDIPQHEPPCKLLPRMRIILRMRKWLIELPKIIKIIYYQKGPFHPSFAEKSGSSSASENDQASRQTQKRCCRWVFRRGRVHVQ